MTRWWPFPNRDVGPVIPLELFRVTIVDSASGSGSVLVEREGVWPDALAAMRAVLAEWNGEKPTTHHVNGGPLNSLSMSAYQQGIQTGDYVNANGRARLTSGWNDDGYFLTLVEPDGAEHRRPTVGEMWSLLHARGYTPLR